MEDGRWTVSTAKNTYTVELQTDSQPDLREKLRRLVTSTLNVCSLDTSKGFVALTVKQLARLC